MGASRRDAVTNMALNIEDGLQRLASAKTFSFHLPDESVGDRVAALGEMGLGSSDDMIVYHLTYGEPILTRTLLDRPERLVVVYHNITPSGFFVSVNPEFALGLQWGRHELRLLAARTELAVADSEYNANELREAGYSRVEVVAAGVDPMRLANEQLDIDLVRQLETMFPRGFVLFVSQLLPHKRPDLAIGAIHLLRTQFGLDVGLVIAGPARIPDFSLTVRKFSDSLPDHRVLILGEVDDSQLATLFRMCRCYLNTSDHEGLAVPPLEAMACGAPVVVRDSGAMGDTVGSGGLVIPQSWGASEIAAALATIVVNEAKLSRLRQRGYERIAVIRPDESVARFVELVGTVY